MLTNFNKYRIQILLYRTLSSFYHTKLLYENLQTPIVVYMGPWLSTKHDVYCRCLVIRISHNMEDIVMVYNYLYNLFVPYVCSNCFITVMITHISVSL